MSLYICVLQEKLKSKSRTSSKKIVFGVVEIKLTVIFFYYLVIILAILMWYVLIVNGHQRRQRAIFSYFQCEATGQVSSQLFCSRSSFEELNFIIVYPRFVIYLLYGLLPLLICIVFTSNLKSLKKLKSLIKTKISSHNETSLEMKM